MSTSPLRTSDLSLVELAVLEMTNDAAVRVPPFRPRRALVTSKEAYYWAALLAFLAESTEITPEQLVNAVKSVFGIPLTHPELPSLGPDQVRTFEEFAEVWARAVFRSLRIEANPEILRGFARQALSAYGSLVMKGLVEDPPVVILSGIAVVVLGLIPVGFTKKTKNGKLISRRMNAAYWTYERKERAGVVQTTIEFRLMKLIKAFTAGFRSALSDEGQ